MNELTKNTEKNKIMKKQKENQRELPYFLYYDGDRIMIGVQPDTDITEMWNDFIEKQNQTKRIHAKEYAEKLYPEQKQYQHIAKAAFLAGEDNAVFMLRKETQMPTKPTVKKNICYKTNEICKHDCEGLCKESY